jgi:hypothetical protein
LSYAAHPPGAAVMNAPGRSSVVGQVFTDYLQPTGGQGALRAKRARTSKGGRPPAGIRQGERVRDYPQLSVRIPPDIRATVQALSTMRGQPQWRIVVDALKS